MSGKEILTQLDLEQVLECMASYVRDCDIEERNQYLHELSNTGLWHDAIGKVVESENNVITI